MTPRLYIPLSRPYCRLWKVIHQQDNSQRALIEARRERFSLSFVVTLRNYYFFSIISGTKVFIILIFNFLFLIQIDNKTWWFNELFLNKKTCCSAWVIIIFTRSRSSARTSSHVFNDAAPLKHPRRAAFCRQKLVGRYVKLVKCDTSRLSTLLSLFRSGSLTIDERIIVETAINDCK